MNNEQLRVHSSELADCVKNHSSIPTDGYRKIQI
jgi:hypothetical protein